MEPFKPHFEQINTLEIAKKRLADIMSVVEFPPLSTVLEKKKLVTLYKSLIEHYKDQIELLKSFVEKLESQI